MTLESERAIVPERSYSPCPLWIDQVLRSYRCRSVVDRLFFFSATGQKDLPGDAGLEVQIIETKHIHRDIGLYVLNCSVNHLGNLTTDAQNSLEWLD